MTDQDRKHVVMFSAEAAPFVKVGGLADVVGALPKMLERLGVRVTIVLPDYQVIPHEKFGIRPSASVPPFEMPMGPKAVRVEVAQANSAGDRSGGVFPGRRRLLCARRRV